MDLIERQAAINTADTMLARCDTGCLQDYHDLMVESLSVLPSVEAEPVRRGRWLPDDRYYYEMRFVCSECKESEVVPTIGFTKYAPVWDYCPNCGAKMEVDDGKE